jgi:Pyruvate/2-oxoacid:ferredoxin oxidoreductase delta subunit
MQDFGARYYEVETGRWVQKDPQLGDIFDPSTLIQYTYCRDNPVNSIDPKGEKAYWEEFCKWCGNHPCAIWFCAVIAITACIEDIYSHITNPGPTSDIHDVIHIAAGVAAVIGGAAIIGTGIIGAPVIGGALIITGVVYAGYHLYLLFD